MSASRLLHSQARRELFEMLENGADIRYVQEMLGHRSLETTQLYTRVAILKLREIHAATHPGARISKPKRPVRDGADAISDTGRLAHE